MVYGAESASCGKALVKHMSCEHDIHSRYLFSGFRIGFGFPCDGHLQQEVVGLAEQLAVLSELSGGIGDTQIYVGFAVSGEEYRFPLYASVLVFRLTTKICYA